MLAVIAPMLDTWIGWWQTDWLVTGRALVCIAHVDDFRE